MGSAALKSTESFDPTTAVATVNWSAGTDMSITRNKPSGVYASGQDLLIVIGGNASTPAVEATTPP